MREVVLPFACLFGSFLKPIQFLPADMDVWEDGTWSDIRAMTRDYLQGRRDTTHEMYGPPDPAHIASDGPALLELNELGVVTTDGQHQIAHTQRAYVDGMFEG